MLRFNLYRPRIYREAKFISFILLLPPLLIFLPNSEFLAQEKLTGEIVHFKGQKLSIQWNSLTRSPIVIRAIGSNLLEIRDISKLSRKEITHTGPLLVNKYKPFLQIEPDQLRLKGAEKISDTWYVSYWQTFQGVIIYESSLGYSIDSRGRVNSLGAMLYPDVQAPVSNKLSHQEALKIGQAQIKDFKKLKCILLAESILVYPIKKKDTIDYYRVYAFNFFPQEALHPASVVGGWAVFVDTQTGKVLLFEELLKPLGCCIPEDWVPPKPEEMMKPKW